MKKKTTNRFYQHLLFFCLIGIALSCKEKETASQERARPNVLVVLTDQWRAQATGYAGDPNISTPHLDRLAAESVNFKNAVSGMPVCSPFRASLLTGQRPLTHGVFMNDVQLDTNAVTLAKVFNKAGYDTGYIGKWHLDGHGRLQNVAPGKRRQGFQFWKGNECTHNYNHSVYYDNDDPERKIWEGYDTFGQTDAAIEYISERKPSKNPFMIILSYGTPHAPYHTAPEEYRRRFDPEKIQLRDNVPDSLKARARKDLAGYYAHIAAIDDMIGKIIANLKESGQYENTLILFTSDHGDLLGSHGAYKKQQPYEEAARVPMLFRIPESLKIAPGERNALMNSEDLMPTLLGLCDIAIPNTVEGINYRPYMEGKEEIGDATLLTCVQPFGQWNKVQHGGREYRALKTRQYTYARDLEGPWLLFDNQKDPYQLNNLVGNEAYADLQEELDRQLTARLKETGDEFLPGMTYIEKWGYPVDETGTVPYTH
ncbi:sulfatase family protein [Pseudozobellia thermophila]|uniref:Arylsulfatase A n=1 Tax=Pseudozobellia thermophila TaxID=192903 RepID=A0A1M6G813_9FLAO|nr:sulfatase [Pseudozobellia thermophila]SHJ06062.1 Arylsulfatase A [Pseudozobellia thermophila]